MQDKPDKAVIDLRIADKVIRFTLYNTDDPELQASLIMQYYDLHAQCRSMLVDRFAQMQKQLRAPEPSVYYYTLEPPVSSILPEADIRKIKDTILQSSLMRSPSSHHSTSLSSSSDKVRADTQAIGDELPFFERLSRYACRCKPCPEAYPKEVSKTGTITEMQMNNLIKRLSAHPQRKPSALPGQPESVSPRFEANERSKQLAKHHSLQSSIEYYIRQYAKQNMQHLVGAIKNQEAKERLLSRMSDEDVRKYMQNQLYEQNNVEYIAANCCVSGGRECPTFEIQEQKCYFQPTIDKISSAIGSCKYLQRRYDCAADRQTEKEPESYAPTLISKQLDKNKLQQSIIAAVLKK